MSGYLPAPNHTYIHTYMHACMHTYMEHMSGREGDTETERDERER